MSPVTPNRAALQSALDIARRDLLDLGLRNTLLNYRPLVGKGLEVIDEKPREIFRLLVEEGKSLTFLPGKEGEPADTPLAQPEEEGAVAARHTDSRLQTAYTSAQLQSRLLATYHAARTSMEEQGVNTLYLALGMLSWRDEDAADKFCRAPLILIPVELERSDARDRFHMEYTGEELGGNVSLAEKLKQSFGIKSFPDLPEADELDVEGYFNAVGIACRGQSGWRVDTNAIALGFFSFAKFLMYRDLDAATWPVADALLDHGILHSLLTDGFEQATSNYNPDQLLDDQLDGREAFHVVDSDSSQTLAILDALDRHSMVIQGPPGTGKSQTIVNLIAAAVAEGKRVLFVSEKMAALDVVKRRLDHVRLGAACLELHSNRTNKKSIIEELRRTALGERPGNPRQGPELSLLASTRQRLNDYCQAVNEPIGESGESPCTAYGKLLAAQSALQNSETPQLSLDNAASWTAEEIIHRTQLVAQLQDRVSRTGVPAEHPFWGTRLKVLLPLDRDAIRASCSTALSACEAYQQSASLVAQSFSVAIPAAEVGVHVLYHSAAYVLGAPDLNGTNLTSNEWLTNEPEIRKVLATGQRHSELHRQFDSVVRPEAWTTDVRDIRKTIAEVGGNWWRLLSGRWRHARNTVAEFCVTPATTQKAQLQLLDAVIETAECSEKLANAADTMRSLFGQSWKGAASDWQLLESQTNWMVGARKGIREGRLAEWCLDADRTAVDRSIVAAQLPQLDTARRNYQTAFRDWAQKLVHSNSPAADPFDKLTALWALQRDRIDDLHSMVAFNQIWAECYKNDLDHISDLATTWPLAATLLVPLYERTRLSALLHRAF